MAPVKKKSKSDRDKKKAKKVKPKVDSKRANAKTTGTKAPHKEKETKDKKVSADTKDSHGKDKDGHKHEKDSHKDHPHEKAADKHPPKGHVDKDKGKGKDKGKKKDKKDKKEEKDKTHPKPKKKKIKLRRYPKNRRFTDPLWMIPFTTWCLFTMSMCALCIVFGDFTWLRDITSINRECSSIHYHLLAYLLNYESYGIALAGAFVVSCVYSIMIQYVSNVFIKITWYMSLITTTVYILALWFYLPKEEKLNCGQSIFSITITLCYLVYVCLMLQNQSRIDLVIGLHHVTMDIYRALPCFRIGLITFIFQLICVGLNVFSMGVTVGVMYASMELTSRIVSIIYVLLFMILEGWLFVFIVYCNQVASAYCVGLWYFAKNKKNIKKVGLAFTVILKHFATIATGSIFLTLHRIFHPVIGALNSGSSAGLEGIFKTALSILLHPFKNTYDVVNPYGFYMVAMYGADYYPAMMRALQLNKIGEEHMLKLNGDVFVITCVLFVSPIALFLGLAWDPQGRMRWWQNMILLFITGLWVSLSFLLTFKFMNTALYMCLCMDMEMHVKKKKRLKFPRAFEKYLKSKEEFGLMWQIKLAGKKRKKKPVFDKKKRKNVHVDMVDEKKKKDKGGGKKNK